MKLRTKLAAIGFSAIAALPLQAQDYTLGDLVINHPYTFETAPNARAGGAYMEITNTGDTPETLIDARADFAEAQLHKTETGDDGITRMIHQENGIPIGPGETVMFQPGGLHVMLMGLQAPFVAGEQRSVTLVFQNAGELDVDFGIQKRSMTGGHGAMNGEMKHGN